MGNIYIYIGIGVPKWWGPLALAQSAPPLIRYCRPHTCSWTAWRCLNRLRFVVTSSKEQRKLYKYFNRDKTCDCGQAPETTKHMLQTTKYMGTWVHAVTHTCILIWYSFPGILLFYYFIAYYENNSQ